MLRYILSITFLLAFNSCASLQKNHLSQNNRGQYDVSQVTELPRQAALHGYPKAPFIHSHDYSGLSDYYKAYIIDVSNAKKVRESLVMNGWANRLDGFIVVAQPNDTIYGDNLFKPQRVFYDLSSECNQTQEWTGVIRYNLRVFNENGTEDGCKKGSDSFGISLNQQGLLVLSRNVANISDICNGFCWKIVCSYFSHNDKSYVGLNILFPANYTHDDIFDVPLDYNLETLKNNMPDGIKRKFLELLPIFN